MKWLESDTKNLQGLNAQSAEFNNRDKKQLWLSTYASGSVATVPLVSRDASRLGIYQGQTINDAAMK